MAVTWASALALSASRAYFGGRLPFLDGKLWAVGGLTSGSVEGSYARSNACTAYDPVSNTWTAKANLPVYMGGHGVAASEDYLYVIYGVYDTVSSSTAGSFNTSSVYRYDPVANSWATQSLDFPIVGRTRGQAAFSKPAAYSAFAPDGMIIYVAGYGGGNVYLLLKILSTGLQYMGGGFQTYTSVNDILIDTDQHGVLYIAGGVGSTQHWKVDFEVSHDMVAIAPLPVSGVNMQPGTYTCAGPLNYLQGGGASDTTRRALYAYDPVSDTWTAKTSSSVSFAAASAGYHPDTRAVYVAGGFSSGSTSATQTSAASFMIPFTDSGSIEMANDVVMSLYAEGVVTMDNVVDMNVDGVDEYTSGFAVGIRITGEPQDPIPMPEVFPLDGLYPSDDLYPLAG